MYCESVCKYSPSAPGHGLLPGGERISTNGDSDLWASRQRIWRTAQKNPQFYQEKGKKRQIALLSNMAPLTPTPEKRLLGTILLLDARSSASASGSAGSALARSIRAPRLAYRRARHQQTARRLTARSQEAPRCTESASLSADGLECEVQGPSRCLQCGPRKNSLDM